MEDHDSSPIEPHGSWVNKSSESRFRTELIKEKVLNKHYVTIKEIRATLFGSPYILKTRYHRYMAIGYYQRFITIIFEKVSHTASIITAYPSSEAQIKLYKLKKA